MSNKPQDYRFERKFFITDLSYQQVDHIIRHNPSFLREIYYKRFINNIYFDSNDLTYYFDNVDGASDRVKVRIRWYGELFGEIEKPVLEFKIKKGLVGTKKQFGLPPFVFDESITGQKIQHWLKQADVPKWVKLMFPHLVPTLVNRYGRKYYQTPDKKYRVTIDDHVTFFKVGPAFNTFSQKETESETIIVELKYEQQYDAQAFDIPQLFPYRLTKSSKYVNGLNKFIA